MSEQAEPDALTVDDHVFAAVTHYSPGDIVTKYLLVAETIDAQTGARSITTIRDDNGSPWDTYALARMATVRADAAMSLEADGEFDPDGD